MGGLPTLMHAREQLLDTCMSYHAYVLSCSKLHSGYPEDDVLQAVTVPEVQLVFCRTTP